MRFYTGQHRHYCGVDQGHDPLALAVVRTIHGMGKVLGLSILYEVQDIGRFARVQEFLSYCGLVKPTKESGGKILGHSGKKIGNAQLKWAFSEAAVGFLRANKPAQALRRRSMAKHGKGNVVVNGERARS